MASSTTCTSGSGRTRQLSGNGRTYQVSILVVVVEGGLLQGGRAEEGDQPPHQLHPGQITFIFNIIQRNLFRQPHLPNI